MRTDNAKAIMRRMTKAELLAMADGLTINEADDARTKADLLTVLDQYLSAEDVLDWLAG